MNKMNKNNKMQKEDSQFIYVSVILIDLGLVKIVTPKYFYKNVNA